MIVTSQKEKDILKEGGRRLARILQLVREATKPGVSTDELDALARRLIEENGDTPSLLGYHPPFAARPYPSTMCISVNDEVVHGIPSENPIILKEGDIVGFDLVMQHKGLHTDSAITVPVGEVDETARKLIATAEEALARGISAARAGGRMGDIGYAIEQCAEEQGFSAVDELGGHAVGDKVHGEPFVPNFGTPGTGPELVEGMVLALEPIVNEGSRDVLLDPDGYTFRTRDGKRSAHFEHTILITKNGAEILTQG